MARRFDDDDDDEPHWLFRFFRGAIVAALLSIVTVVVLSLYILPPAKLPDPVAPVSTGPVIIDGIVVSDAPAYTTSGTQDGAAIPQGGQDGTATPQAQGDTATPEAQAPMPEQPIEQTQAPAPEAAQAGTGNGAAPETGQPALREGPALNADAVPFEAPPGFPLVAIVLDDTASNPLLLPDLFALKLPVAVGVVAGFDGDREVAMQAHDAGYEVVAELPLAGPGQGTGVELEFGLEPAEAEARTARLIERLPMAVAASRPLAASGLPDPDTLKGMAQALSGKGLAYVDHGVRPGERSLLEMLGLGLPVGTGRYLVPAGASLVDVLAILDRASMDAGPEGGAVILATPSVALFQALQLWGGEGSVSAGVLAPLSVVIARQSAGN